MLFYKSQINVLNLILAILITSCHTNTSTKNDRVRIGVVIPLTGKSAQYGEYIKNGLDLALSEINEKGGINGDSLNLIFEDDQADPKLAVNAVNKFIQVDKVPLIFGSWASSCVLAEAPIAEKNKIPLMAEAQSPKIREAGDYIFRIQPDSRYYLKYLVPYIYNKNIKKMAILYVNNDYGKDQADVFKNLFEEMGGTIVYAEGFTQGASEFKTQLTKIKDVNVDGVFIPAYTEAGYILKQAKELSITTQFVGSAPIENPEILAIAGNAADGIIYPHHFDPESSDSLTARFVLNYRKRYGQEVEGYAALAYDALHIIANVLATCKQDKECIKSELYRIKDLKGVTGPTTFDDHGDVVKPIIIRTVKNGRFVTLFRH